MRTRRTGVRVADGDRSLADVTVDVVEVLDDARSAGTFAEIEVELIDGDEDDLRRLSRELRRAGARKSDGRPKLMRLLALPPAHRIGKGASVLEQLRVLLEEQLHEIEAPRSGGASR